MNEKLEPIVDKYVRDLERMLPHVLKEPITKHQKQKENKNNREKITTISCALVKVSFINKGNIF